jgi:hypothetical protein
MSSIRHSPLSTLTLYPLWGQGGSDSVRITHTQEAGTLEKQRFIDKYDYVFMTMEPTKWMLKAYGNINNLLGSEIFRGGHIKRTVDFRVGVERKLSPSFSIEINATRNGISPFQGKRLHSTTQIIIQPVANGGLHPPN